MKIVEILNKIQTSSKLEQKASAIKENDSETLKHIFEDTYTKDKYNVTSKNIVLNSCGDKTLEDNYDEFRALLLCLKNRELTGNAALDATISLIGSFVKEDQQTLLNILDHNLLVGLTLKQYQKIVGIKAQKPFEVALAFNLDKVNGVNPIDGTYFASRKLDGLRCITKIDLSTHEVTFISRQNKVFTTLDNLKPSIIEFFMPMTPQTGVWYLDGELCLINDKGQEDFQAILKEARKKDHTIKNPSYCVFDILTEKQFEGLEVSKPFSTRYDLLKDSPAVKNIIILPQERIMSQEQFDKWTEKVEKNDWEGFMLRKDVPYKSGRTKDLIKVKKFIDAEYVVKDIALGDINYAEPGKGIVTFKNVLKDFTIEHNGCDVHVGSGITKDQRIYYAKHPEELIGKTVTVQYFEETKNQNGGYSLRFPVLRQVWGTERDF